MLVNETDRAYKRGIVLGLTLAELLILFVFCLLLLFAAWAGRSLESKAAQVEPPTTTEQTWELIRREMEKLADARPIEEFWRDLQVAYLDTKRERKSSTDSRSDESARARVLDEMERMRGANKLEDYWRELRLAKDDAGRLSSVNKDLIREVKELEEKLARAEAALERAKKSGETPSQESRKGHTWPPIISLRETEGYSFQRGHASLEPAFEKKLREEVIGNIVKYIQEYKVDVIEVVGHTDETHMSGRSNLDAMLLRFLHGDRSGTSLSAGDNAGLGMARAASVARFLMNDPRLHGKGYRILPLSPPRRCSTTTVYWPLSTSLAIGQRGGESKYGFVNLSHRASTRIRVQRGIFGCARCRCFHKEFPSGNAYSTVAGLARLPEGSPVPEADALTSLCFGRKANRMESCRAVQRPARPQVARGAECIQRGMGFSCEALLSPRIEPAYASRCREAIDRAKTIFGT